MNSKKIEYLVVDTGAFLKNASIQDLADNVITCQEVVNEVTSKRQIRRLVVLPYDLQVKDVFIENLQFVTEFSKKTGDYPSLSATDLKVIALTYQLEKEKVGTDHLKKSPEAQKTITFQNKPAVDPKDVPGFYLPSKDLADEDDEVDENSETLCQNFKTLHCSDSQGDTETSLHPGTVDGTEVSPESGTPDSKQEEEEALCVDDEEGEEEESESISNTDSEDGGESGQSFDEVDPSTVLVKIQDSNSPPCETDHTEHDSENDSDNSEEDDEGGWITPGNISHAKKQMNADFEEEKAVKVACITTDFAMQNVLKQIGLNVSSVDGRIIKQLRTFILRCYACFKTTSLMTKVFCPHCGHKTLKRVAVSVEPDGSQKIHINLKKRLTTRGKKFSMPTFQGGKHANNPIIFADQPVPDQRPSRRALLKTNILDVDYIPGFSPFAMRDTTSKSAMLGIRGSKEMKHWMQRNPNESKPHSGRKKKK